MPKVLQRMSQREYAKYLGISNEAVSRAVGDGRIKKGWDTKAQKIIVEHANKEFGFLHKDLSVSETTNQDTKEDENDKNENGDLVVLGKKTSYVEARRAREINEANIAAKKDKLVELELKQKTGELVNKDEVFKTLFSFGQELRISMLSIPDRVIDSILAAKSRSDAHNELTKAIHEVLTTLTEPRELDFKERK